MRRKLDRTLVAMVVAGGFALASAAQANIVYDVNLAIGAGGVVGTITTDGHVGLLGASDILAWNLTVIGNGGVTFNLVNNGLSGVEVGNNSDMWNPTLGTADLTADVHHIYFNFSGTDGGYFGFQTLPFYGGQNYWSCGASNNLDCAQGLAVVPVRYSHESSIFLSEAGSQIIATAGPPGRRPSSFVYNDFAAANLIRFNGSAAKATTSDGPVLELTPASANQAGSAFTANSVVLDPKAGFGTFFTFRLSKPGNTPAGGITFTIQSASPSSLGSSGSALGYSGITNSLSVGFGADNRVSININGVLNAAYATNNAMNDGNIWYAWVDYSGGQGLLEVRLSKSPGRPPAAKLAAIVNLPGILGTTNAYVGFTGGSGSGWNQQDILAWKFMALPTANYAGHYAFTNVSPSFSLTNALVIKRFTYKVQGCSYTNIYGLPVVLTPQPDGSVDFVTPPESTPILEANNGIVIDENNPVTDNAQDGVDMISVAEYADPAPGFAANGVFVPMLAAVAAGQSFADTFPATTEATAQGILETSGNQPPLPAPPTNPNQAIQNGFLNGLKQVVDQQINQLNTGLAPEYSRRSLRDLLQSAPPPPPQQPPSLTLGDLSGELIGTLFSGARNCGTVTVRERLSSQPQLSLAMSAPSSNGTYFRFAFLTVPNLRYTVWSATNLVSPNWVVCTNLVGNGYPKIFTTPFRNSAQGFYRLSSP